jgi:hypothetical protein
LYGFNNIFIYFSFDLASFYALLQGAWTSKTNNILQNRKRHQISKGDEQMKKISEYIKNVLNEYWKDILISIIFLAIGFVVIFRCYNYEQLKYCENHEKNISRKNKIENIILQVFSLPSKDSTQTSTKEFQNEK